ncbi:MAG: hypothetical protein ACR2RV_18465, partial [Verrucomicrobiales bacterium]
MNKPINPGAGQIFVPPLLLAALAGAIFLIPGAGAALQFEPGRIANALTGHFTHWNRSHLLWDSIALGALGVLCCYFSTPRFWLTVLTSAIVIPIAVATWHPELTSYRGLSGIDSALLGLGLIELARHAIAHGRRGQLILSGSAAVGFGLKSAFEYFSGAALFVSGEGADFINVPLAHLVGFGCGVLVALLPTMQRPRGGFTSPLEPRTNPPRSGRLVRSVAASSDRSHRVVSSARRQPPAIADPMPVGPRAIPRRRYR